MLKRIKITKVALVFVTGFISMVHAASVEVTPDHVGSNGKRLREADSNRKKPNRYKQAKPEDAIPAERIAAMRDKAQRLKPLFQQQISILTEVQSAFKKKMEDEKAKGNIHSAFKEACSLSNVGCIIGCIGGVVEDLGCEDATYMTIAVGASHALVSRVKQLIDLNYVIDKKKESLLKLNQDVSEVIKNIPNYEISFDTGNVDNPGDE